LYTLHWFELTGLKIISLKVVSNCKVFRPNAVDICNSRFAGDSAGIRRCVFPIRDWYRPITLLARMHVDHVAPKNTCDWLAGVGR